jgi:putative ABC transport system permease protein
LQLGDSFFLSFDALVDRKVRTVLTVLMVVLGSSLVVVLNGLSAGQSSFLEAQFNSLAGNLIFVSSGQHSYHSSSSSASLVINDIIVDKIKSLPFVTDVIPKYQGSVEMDTEGNTQHVTVIGMDSTKLQVKVPNLQFVDGSTVNPDDRAAVIVGDIIAKPPGAIAPFVILGQTIKLTYTYANSAGQQEQEVRNFVVRAIIKPTGDSITDNSIFINRDAANQLLQKSNRYDSLYVMAVSPAYVNIVQQEIRTQYGNTLGVITPQSIIAIRENAASGNNAFILMVGIIALVVGAMGIVTTLYNSVNERTREIGTMKAIGAENRHILSLFLIEAVLIGVIGASLGLAIGVGAGYLASTITSFPSPGGEPTHIAPIFLPADLVKVWLLALTLSIMAGGFPAWKASRLSPLVALRRD